MMPVIRISDPVFERLQKIAVPLVDTPGTVIEKILDFYENTQKHPAAVATTGTRTYSDSSEEAMSSKGLNFTHTRVLSGSFDGRPARNWNDLVHKAHIRAFEVLGGFESLQSATRSHIVRGRRTDEGFRYLPEINISIQNVDANKAWENSERLAERIQVRIEVEFEWLGRGEHPGQKRRIAGGAR